MLDNNAFTSIPIPCASPSVTCVVLFMISWSIFALFPSPYIVILSTLDSGSATFFAISGSACMIISIIAASPYFFIASDFLSIPSASAVAFARMASASARPVARIPSASCSLANRTASAMAFFASASCCCSNFFASASFWRLNSSACACCSSR